MNKRFFAGMSLLVPVIFLVMLSCVPVAQAIDSTRIVLLPITDAAGYKSPELNAALLNKLRSQFRFPKYEIVLPAPVPTVFADRPSLEKALTDNAADAVVALEITRLRSFIFSSVWDEEMVEQTDLTLTLSYFDKKSGQYGRVRENRSATEIMGVFSGALPLSLDALEDILNKLDAIFPRQFPGPRY